MILRDHPRIEWPPHWSEGDGVAKFTEEEGTLTDVDLIGPTQIMLGSKFNGRTRFAELNCSNPAFASKLVEKITLLVGRPVKDVGAVEIVD